MTRKTIWVFASLSALILLASSTQADIIISAPELTAAPGSSGNFDISLTNTGSSGISVGAFTFDISTGNPGITFTDASTTTAAAPYIFAGDSFADVNGLPFATKTGQELIASDTPNDGIAAGLNPASNVSLGQVSYSIAPSAALGTTSITFSLTGTSLANSSGAPIAFTAQNGSIDVTSVPEPVPALLFITGLALLACAPQIRKRINLR